MVALTATLLLVPSATNAAASASTIFGFNAWVSAHSVADQASLGAGIGVRRMFVYWDRVEPVDDRWDWDGAADRAMDGADEEYDAVVNAGLQPLIVAQSSPRWARSRDNLGPPDRAHDADWQEFIEQLVQRYPAAIAIEIWNEPNLSFYFYPVDPVRYTELLKLAYQQVNRRKPVISGGLAGDVSHEGWTTQTYLNEMFMQGAGSAMDGLGIHVYPQDKSLGVGRWSADGFEPTLDTVRKMRDDHGATQPLWITEVGESTETAVAWPPAITPEQQTADLITMIGLARGDRDVAAMMLHTVDDPPAFWGTFWEPVWGNRGFGVFKSISATEEATQPKPAACAIAREFGGSLQSDPRCA